MVTGISSQNFQPNAAMEAMRTKMDNFRSGRANLSKEDLTSMVSDMKSKGMTEPEDLKQILSNYDKIDVNSDGTSFDEVTSYAKENNIELGGPFGKDGPKGPPPGGVMGGQPPGGSMGGPSPNGQQMQGSTDSDTTTDTTSSLLENLKSLISNYLKTDTDQITNNFTIFT